MGKYLDNTGLSYLWGKIKATFALKSHTHNYAGSTSAGGAAATALACTGNAATATKATQDSTGQTINTTYIKGLSISGKVITYTKGNGTNGTLTVQADSGGATAAGAAAVLSASQWTASGEEYIQTVNVAGVTASSLLVAAPAEASRNEYSECGIRATGQAAGTITFTAESMPTAALTANVMVVN